jgi:hypothetical protein
MAHIAEIAMAGGELMRRDPHRGLEPKSGLRSPEQELDIDRGLDLMRIAPSADPVDDVSSMRKLDGGKK